MAVIKRFEDIEAWQKARELTRQIYLASNEGQFAKDFGLRDQMRRAAVSIMSNIAEGFGRSGNKEFIHFLSMAKGSASEIQAQLYVAADSGYVNQELFQKLYEEAEVTSKLIGGLLRYLQNNDLKGVKYK
jgi:four helix bundle protein